MSNWFRSADKAPPPLTDVLLFDTRSRSVEIGYSYADRYKDAKFYVYAKDESLSEEIITHWQPLPEPPME